MLSKIMLLIVQWVQKCVSVSRIKIFYGVESTVCSSVVIEPILVLSYSWLAPPVENVAHSILIDHDPCYVIFPSAVPRENMTYSAVMSKLLFYLIYAFYFDCKKDAYLQLYYMGVQCRQLKCKQKFF